MEENIGKIDGQKLSTGTYGGNIQMYQTKIIKERKLDLHTEIKHM